MCPRIPCPVKPAPPSAEGVFAEALEIDGAAQRDAYVRRACASDDALRVEVESLLAAHDRAGVFMQGEALAEPEQRDRVSRSLSCGPSRPPPHGLGATTAKPHPDTP